MAIPVGIVGIEPDGSVTPGSNGFAYALYLKLKSTSDIYTAQEGGPIAPDSERVKELQYYALQATELADVFCPHLV